MYYAIRVKNKPLFLPQGRSRGFTHDEPTDTQPPRLFTTKRGAQQALNWWLRGGAHAIHSVSFEGEHDEELTIDPRSDRLAGNMEIVKVVLIHSSLLPEVQVLCVKASPIDVDDAAHD